MIPIAVAVDTAIVGHAIYTDVKNETARNTVEAVTTTAAGWGCGYGGAVGGAAIGTAILPGIGTIFGGIIGGIAGGIGGAAGASALTCTIADKKNFGMTKKICRKCENVFKIRKYRGEKDTDVCPDCSENEIKDQFDGEEDLETCAEDDEIECDYEVTEKKCQICLKENILRVQHQKESIEMCPKCGTSPHITND